MDFLICKNRHRSPSNVAPGPGANETHWSELMQVHHLQVTYI
jgi:hypothetical protein